MFLIPIFIGLIFLLVYLRLSRNYRKAERLIEELRIISKNQSLTKLNSKVTAGHDESIITTGNNVSIYKMKQGYLFFQGKDEIDDTTIWLYYSQENRNFIQNCRVRGKIDSFIEDENKISLTIDFMPFGLFQDCEIYK
jgi:hypothetical protein